MKLLTIELSDELFADLERCERITLIRKSALVNNMLKTYTARLIQKDLDDTAKLLKPRTASEKAVLQAVEEEGIDLQKGVYHHAGI